MNPKISIIVPVYKSEKFVCKCINSILGQTFDQWELILVNDCSPDGSYNILTAYMIKDNRIKVINHSVNSGVSQARFTGLDHAQGKFIVFVDSDDWLPKKALEFLYNKIEYEEADIVIGSSVKVMDKFGFIKTKPKNINSTENRIEIITKPELHEKYFISFFGVNLLPVTMWGRIYRRTTIDKASLKPLPFFFGEDLIFNMVLHPFLSKIGFVTEPVYYYRYGGSTSTSTPNLLKNTKRQYLLKQEYINKYNYIVAVPYIKYELINCFYSHFLNLALLDKKLFPEIGKLIEEELKDSFYCEDLFEEIKQSERSLALKSRNISKILAIVKKDVRDHKPKHLAKRIIAKVLG